MNFDEGRAAELYLRDFQDPFEPKGLRQFLSFLNGDDRLGEDPRYLSYVLATVRHETARSFLPLEEIGKGLHKPYGQPDPVTGKCYYGRGYAQTTWLRNYELYTKRLGIDLVNRPEDACIPAIAYQMLILGMTEGLYTGKKLADFINDRGCDYRRARRIINGLDRAGDIAEYAFKFETIMKLTRVTL